MDLIKIQTKFKIQKYSKKTEIWRMICRLKLGKPVEKDKWGMTPPTINAYYTPTKNQVDGRYIIQGVPQVDTFYRVPQVDI